MSRIGKLPIALPKGVTIELSEGEVSAKGPKGSLSCTLPPLVSVSQADNVLSVSAVEGEEPAKP